MRHCIFHVDVNSAFLSFSAVKRLRENPSALDLRTVPSAVGGDVSKRHGVITAKSLPAKRYGIRTGEPVVSALKKCPDLILIPSDFSTYRSYSKALIHLLRQFSPLVEQASIDEAYLDMGVLNAPIDTAVQIKDQIRRQLGFTVNVGISTNKLLAKMASDFEKPDRVHTLWPEEISEKLWPLPLSSLYGCGRASASRLASYGMHTIGDAANAECGILQSILGERAGSCLWDSANGRGSATVTSEREAAKSYSNEQTTVHDIHRENYDRDMPPLLKSLSQQVARRLKQASVRALTIGIIVKTGTFRRFTRQLTLNQPTNDPARLFSVCESLMKELLFGADGLFQEKQVVRLVGVSAQHLETPAFEQLSLFDLRPPEKRNTAGSTPSALLPSAPSAAPPSVPSASSASSASSVPSTAPVSSASPVSSAALAASTALTSSAASAPSASSLTSDKEQRLKRMLKQLNLRYGEGIVQRGTSSHKHP